RDPADDRGQVDHVRAAPRGVPRLLQDAQVAGVDLAALAHPRGRRALVGDADLVVGIAQQPAHDGGADRAGSAGDQDTVHGARKATPAAISFAYAKTCPAPKQSHGSTISASLRAPSASSWNACGPQNASWFVAITTASASMTASAKLCVGVATWGSCTATSAS